MNINVHIRRYISLSILIFALVTLGHALRIGYEWTVVIGGYELPFYISWLVLIVTVLMLILGLAYLRK